jgi:hypothetical protein
MRQTTLALIAAASIGFSAPAFAQVSETNMAFELRPVAGLFVPTGRMRDDFKATFQVGFQGGFEVNDHAHLLLSGMWAQTDARFPTLTQKQTDIWQFDAGAELNLLHRINTDWLFRPFIGSGIGARTYDYRMEGAGSKTCTVGYLALGTEFQMHEVAVRLENRNHVSCFSAPLTGAKQTLYDLGLTLGVVYHVM